MHPSTEISRCWSPMRMKHLLGIVTFSGSTVVGQTLIAANNLSDPDGIGTVTYQWLRNGQQISLGVTLKDGINGVDGLDDPRVLAISPDGKNIYVVGLEDAVSWYDFNMSSGVLNFSVYLGMVLVV